MTPRERLMTALAGERPDRVPFTCYEWLIPPTPCGRELVASGGLIPISACGLADEIRDGFSVTETTVGSGPERRLHRTVTTPLGTLTEITAYDPTLGSPWLEKHMVADIETYPILQYVFEHTRLAPNNTPFAQTEKRLGDRGITLGMVNPIPIARLWVQYMGAEAWCEGMMLETDAFDALHDALLALYRREIDVAAASPADVIWLPDNVTGTMISPATFAKYGVPAYDYACSTLRAAGKKTFAHYDGANRTLASAIARTGIDIVEAFTPPPMGDLAIADARVAWPDKVLSLNIPGMLFSARASVIRDTIAQYLAEGGDRAFAIGCTEDYDPRLFETAFPCIADAIARC